MAVWVAIIDLIKSALWPALFAGCFFFYRHEFKQLIPRIRKAGATGFEVDPAESAEQQKKISSDTAIGSEVLKDFSGLSRTAAIKEVELEIHKQLKQKIDSAEIRAEDQVDYLVRHLAEDRLCLKFERDYSIILGSQILMLKNINEKSHLKIEDAKSIFDFAKAKFPDIYDDFSYDNWVSFPQIAGLMIMDGNRFKLTNNGKDFLLYLTIRGMTTEKYG